MAFNNIEPPALPLAPDNYERSYQDQLNNVGRLFYNRLIPLINAIAAAVIRLQGQETRFDTTLPTPSVAYRGIFAYLDNGPGVADVVYVCTKDAGGGYSWKVVA